ncbi:hypothetical protein MASR1M65_03900 [Saprospiraceae bacterium]
MLQNMLQRNPIMPTADLSKRPSIAKIKHPDTGTVFYSHDGNGYKGLRLSVGKATKTWVLSKRVGSSIKSILGAWPEIATSDMALTIEAEAGRSRPRARCRRDGHQDAEACRLDRIKNSTAKKATLDTYKIEIDTYLTDLFAKPVERVSLPMMEEVVRNIERAGKVSTAEHVCALITLASRRASIPARLAYGRRIEGEAQAQEEAGHPVRREGAVACSRPEPGSKPHAPCRVDADAFHGPAGEERPRTRLEGR